MRTKENDNRFYPTDNYQFTRDRNAGGGKCKLA